MLPMPAAGAMSRAERLLGRFLGDTRRQEPSAQAAMSAARAPEPRPPSPRRYDATLAFISGAIAAGEVGEARGEDDPTRVVWTPDLARAGGAEEAVDTQEIVEELVDGELELEPSEVEESPGAPLRPPPGAPVIRPSVPAPRGAQAVDAAALETLADSGFLSANPDGTASFEIAFNDDVFSELACRISIKDGAVIATFLVGDVNTRRLLEAEAGRLRARLEQRGLRVSEVRVEMG